MTKIQSSHGLCNIALIEKPLKRKEKSYLRANLGAASLDSLKVRIPTNRIKNFDKSRLIETTIKVDSNGVLLAEKQRYRLEKHGFLMGIRLETNKGYYHSPEELVLMFSSKLLGRKYFEGINKENIALIHAYIASKLEEDSIGFLSYDSFMNGSITDVDIKSDMIDKGGFKAINLKKVINLDGAARTMKTFSAIGRATYKTGVQLSNRKQASQGVPFFKIYNKGYEIDNRCLEAIKKGCDDFYLTLPNIKAERKVRDVWRVELTMKNSAMLKANNLPNTLGGILNVSSQRLYQVLEENFYKWSKSDYKPVKESKQKEGLSAEELALIFGIRAGCFDLESYLLLLRDGGIPKRTLERKKKRFKELTQMVLMDRDYVVKSRVYKAENHGNFCELSIIDLRHFCKGILYCEN